MIISKDTLVEYYSHQRKSISQIAKILGCGSTLIQKHLVIHQIPRRNSGEHHIKHVDVNKLIELYNSGLSAKSVGKQLGISEPTVIDRLRDNGVEVKKYIPKSAIEDDDYLKQLYINDKKSAENVALILNVSAETVLKRLKRLGVNIRSGKEQLTASMPDLHKLYVVEKKSTKEIANLYNVNATCVSKHMRNVGIRIRDEYISSYELEIRKWLNEIRILHEVNKRNLIGKELDIIIPDRKLAIEFNGSYWHTENWIEWKYHINKSLKCKEIGYHLIHVWEWLWLDKPFIVKSIIKSFLGFGQKLQARKCKIKELTYKECHQFLNLNHIQGAIPATKYYGLFFQNELVQLMSFTDQKIRWEISRLCTKLDHVVIGGTERLWSRFIKDHNPMEVLTYSDASMFTGNVYERLGMKRVGITEPDYVWIKGKEVLSRQKCQKHKLVKAGHIGDTENSIMRSLGYAKLYKCGNHKFVWIRQ